MARENNLIKVLICDRQPRAFEEIDQAMVGDVTVRIAGWARSSAELQQQLKGTKPDILILDMDNPAINAQKDLKEVYVQSLPVGEIVIFDEQDTQRVRAAMRLGAEDFQIRPVAPEALVGSIFNVFNAVVTRHKDGWKDEVEAVAPVKKLEGKGKLIGVTSGKAGVGKTAIATNLAISIAQETHKKVGLLDLDHGDSALLLLIHPERALVEVETPEELTPESVGEYEMEHGSGITLLVGANTPDIRDLDHIKEDFLERLLQVMRAKFDYTVVSLPVLFDESELSVLNRLDEILCVTTGRDLMDMRATRSFLARVKNMDAQIKDRIKIIANFVVPKRFIGDEELGRALGFPVIGVVADEDLVANSVNTGEPLMVSSPGSPVGLQVQVIARRLLGLQVEEQSSKGWKFWR